MFWLLYWLNWIATLEGVIFLTGLELTLLRWASYFPPIVVTGFKLLISVVILAVWGSMTHGITVMIANLP
ncbi:MAG: hypothetical protein C7B47_14090 [Sulfobacillus thermosulfidooxidans]|uniref:Uncharacterized protein n=1 Tax=Sulfobacillus thermosulfidooxidans TaxID=28034 RepID=A0A2T2WR82_SULTH|nr:MAG: hypothetical protein C7B47_14090 [Sulfobacillus thermosulfidooxidans]